MQFFKKIGARHRASVHENKNRTRWHMIFRTYCRYYGCYYYRMMTVVTTIVMTVATENRMTTHAIFSHLRMPDVGHFFKKKSSCKATTTTTTITIRSSTQRSLVQKSGEPKTTMNTHSGAFAVVAAIAETSQVCAVSSRAVGTIRNHVSQAAGACSDDSSMEM